MTGDESTDRIEREIVIDAPIARVWSLVSEPGWWIGDGHTSADVISRDGDLVVVDFPPYGKFSVLTVSTEARAYAAYRSGEGAQAPGDDTSTLVEFFLREQDGSTVLRVVESGFASLSLPVEGRAAAIEDNIDGWEQQLGFAKREAERGR